MRRSIPALLLFAASAALFAQSLPQTLFSGAAAPLLNRFDGMNGYQAYYIDYRPVVGDFNGDGNADFVPPGNYPLNSPQLITALGRGDNPAERGPASVQHHDPPRSNLFD